ncbi:MAG: Na(+)/H(+) antiporter subunit D [Longimicrobiales bacterium]|jgi:multicomponent Na+:H+ antiporter subunit D|nr:Na(+)/H(+) antiporter subunit D [Longimicrobiales bacterium]
MWIDAPPFVLLFIGGLLAAVTRGRIRQALLVAVPILGGVNLIGMQEGVHLQWEVAGYTLSVFEVDRMSLMFGYLFHIATLIGNVFALHLGDEDRATVQHSAAMLYAGSALGAVFAGDLVVLFIFWELLALTSVFLIWARGEARAYKAGFRYLIIHVLSGVLLLSGTMMRAWETGSINLEHIGLDGSIAAWVILLALGIKAAFPLLHNWLTDAYPEGTPTGTVFLSAFTTKVAVYALARTFAGEDLLIYIGATMTAFPIFYAVIENDLRRVLGYSMINQIGFMVTGIGIGTALAVNGAVAHAFNDVIFKGLLFMSMGAVLHQTGRINGSDLGGLHKSMPLTAGACMVGAASISAFPLFSGFVSKSMVMAAAIEEGHTVVWLVLLFAAAGVFHHAGIKIPFFAFFGHDSGIRTNEAPRNMLIAMGIAVVLNIVIGAFPEQTLYRILPFDASYHPYDLTHVLTQTQLLFFGALAFVGLQKTHIYPPELRSTNIDADWTYRKLGPWIVTRVGGAVGRVDSYVRAAVMEFVHSVLSGLDRLHGEVGPLARSWPSGSMVFWVALLLAAYLLFYLF